jgi:hypothetical protein
MEIHLFDRNLTSPAFVEDLTTKVVGLKFSTKLSGGFGICSFGLRAGIPETWEWLKSRVFYRLVITDRGKTLWEGRVEDIELSFGYAGITAYGYYASLTDKPYKTSYSGYASATIKTVLTANCPQISSDQSHIDDTDISISSSAGSDYLNIYPQELFEKLLAFSDTTKGKWYFAIWEDRIPHLFKRSISSVDWFVSLGDLVRFRLKHRAANLWNSCYAVRGGSWTSEADDTTSQSRYGVTRQYVVPDLGGVSSTAAEAQRDAWLEEHKDIWPEMEDIVLGGTVYDANGVASPSSWVRAGDVIRIRDLVPATGDLATVARDALRTFHIVETQHSVDSKQTRIVVDTESASLSAVLARMMK